MTPMVEKLKQIKEELEIDEKSSMIMDAGYDNESEILQNKDDKEVEILVESRIEARKQNKKNHRIRKRVDVKKVPQPGYESEYFKYDKEKDVCFCPMGQILERSNKKPKRIKSKKYNRYKTKQCKNCISKHLCSKNLRGREIYLSVNKKELDEYFELMKTKENKKKIVKRKEIVEHPFGTIKRNWGFGYFMQRGINNVKAEFSFICFIYNLKRVLHLVQLEDLFGALKTI